VCEQILGISAESLKVVVFSLVEFPQFKEDVGYFQVGVRVARAQLNGGQREGQRIFVSF
jgi:hypothetical protein